ncbi:MAG: hypothetical protein JSW18_04745 [Candidatus Omnitrophota bacterium]|nr:MAG: hypothetical protein JSW18_04745 [Candidatus Omnitrophota bacterium]
MDKINVSLDSLPKKPEFLGASPLQPYFSLKKCGYILEKALNNENRWHTKVVCNILDRDSKRYVSTAYTKQNDYLGLLETTTYLKCNNKLIPEIVKIYPKDKTIICDYIGEFLSDYLLNNPADITLSLTSVFDYLKDINSINQSYKIFIIPSIIKTALELSKRLVDNFEFLPKVKIILPKVEDSRLKFTYGYGIEDPHIWNFRIVKTKDAIQALTTDFDYFSDNVNCFWELGYFYATFRWLKRISLPFTCKAEEILLSLIQNQDLKSEFMFWLGALSSYCGYKDSLRNLMMNGGISKLIEQYRIIQQLDEKVFYLANKILKEKSIYHVRIRECE